MFYLFRYFTYDIKSILHQHILEQDIPNE